MFKFMKRIFVSTIMIFGCNLSSVNPLECVSINNQECKVRPEIINVNAVVVVTILMIPMQNCVFLMWIKI